MQEETDVLPVERFVVDIPVGHCVQDDAPADEYVPDGHVKQLDNEIAPKIDE